MTPIAHTVVGLGGWIGFSKRPGLGEMAAFILAANLPDADFLLRIVPVLRRAMPHQYFTHNLVFALLSAVLLFGLVRTARSRMALMGVALSHLVLDLMVTDTAVPIGFPMLWPFSSRLFHVGGFPPLQRGDLATVLSWRNLKVVILELLLFALPLWLLAGKRITAVVNRWRNRDRALPG